MPLQVTLALLGTSEKFGDSVLIEIPRLLYFYQHRTDDAAEEITLIEGIVKLAGQQGDIVIIFMLECFANSAFSSYRQEAPSY